jgi:hypothetical protein
MCWTFIQDNLRTRTYYRPGLRFAHKKLKTSRFGGFFPKKHSFLCYLLRCPDLVLFSSFAGVFLRLIRSLLYWCASLLLFNYFLFSMPLPFLSCISSLNLSCSPFIIRLSSKFVVFNYALFNFNIIIIIIIIVIIIIILPISGLSVRLISIVSSVLGSFYQISLTLLPCRWRQPFPSKLWKHRPNA